MKYFFMLFIVSTIVSAQSFSQSFDSSSPDYDQKTTPKKEVDAQKKIADSMKLNCTNGSCNLVGTDQHGEGWTVSFMGGVGNQPNGTQGNNFYIGDNNNVGNQPYYGATVTYKNFTCHTNMTVPDIVYEKLMAYMNSTTKKDGEMLVNFQSSQNTMLMFYISVLNKIENCRQNN